MRKYNLVIVLLGTLFFLSLHSCSKDEDNINTNENPEENILNDNAFIVDTLSIISTAENQITVAENSITSSYSVGDIVLSPPCTNAPYGFMRKILSINVIGSSIIYETEQSALNEAFAELHIDQTFDGDFDLSQEGKATQIGGGTLNYNFLNNTTFYPGLKLNGSVKANFSDITFKYTKKRFTFLPTYVLLKASMNTNNSSLEISAADPQSIVAPEMTYATFTLPDFYIYIPITTPIGIITLPIRCVQKASIKGGELSLNGKAKWNILPKINAVMGMKYENGSWENLCTLSSDASASPLVQANFNPQVSMNAEFTMFKPVYEVSPYGANMIRFYTEAPIKLSFDAQTESPNYSLDFDVSLKAGVTSKFWTGEDGGPVTLTIPLYSKTLREGDWDLLEGTWNMVSYGNGTPVGIFTFSYNQDCSSIWDYKQSESGSFTFEEGNFTYSWVTDIVMPNLSYNPITCEIYSDDTDSTSQDIEEGSGTYTTGLQYILTYTGSSEVNSVQFITPDHIKIFDQEFTRQ